MDVTPPLFPPLNLYLKEKIKLLSKHWKSFLIQLHIELLKKGSLKFAISPVNIQKLFDIALKKTRTFLG